MKFLTLCCSSIFLLALYEPIRCERELIGVANYVWYNDDEYPGPIAVYRDDTSGMLALTPGESPGETILWCKLIDFSAQINNLVYLNVEKQDDNIVVAFSNISAVHNIFVHLCPFSEDQTDDILVSEVVLQLGDGTLSTVGNPAAIDVHPREDTDDDFNRYVIHSRFNKKLPIAIFDTREFNIRSINKSRFVILAIRPDDGEGEIFYYGLEFPSLTQTSRLVREARKHANYDILIPDELNSRFIARFCSETEIPPSGTQPNVKRGSWLEADFVR